MMRYTKQTALPVATLAPIERLKEKYACGVRVDLDESQLALLADFESMYPREKLDVLAKAERAGRAYVTGADLLAVAKDAIDREAVIFV